MKTSLWFLAFAIILATFITLSSTAYGQGTCSTQSGCIDPDIEQCTVTGNDCAQGFKPFAAYGVSCAIPAEGVPITFTCDCTCVQTGCNNDGVCNSFGTIETCSCGDCSSRSECQVSYCGDGAVQSPNDAGQYEQCDAGASNGVACMPAYGGSCSYCSSSCQTVTLNGGFCGDGIVNGPEQCDGSNLNGQTCQTKGYTGGALRCTASCTFNTGSCTVAPWCGDGTCNGNEDCSTCSGDCGSCPVTGSCSPNPCTSPPASTCSDTSTKVYYTSPGTCTVSGSTYTCEYPRKTMTCSYDCSNGQCNPPSGTKCGQNGCEAGETCSSCPQDCGACPNNAPFGWIDEPNGDTWSGTGVSSGWALDDTMVKSVKVWLVGPTNTEKYTASVCDVRNDVCNVWSSGYSYDACSGERCKSGWSLSVDTLQMQNGNYLVYAEACDASQCVQLSGSPRSVTIDNGCPSGKILCSGSCVTPTCSSNANCASGYTCSNPGTCSAQCVPVGDPTGDIDCNSIDGPCTITSGQSVTISWSSSNANSCGVYLTGSSTHIWTGTSGTQTDSPSSSSAYNLECWNAQSQRTVDSVTVNVQSTNNCGNGQIDSGEQCDGFNLNNQDCISLEYSGGTLSCKADCTFDTGRCTTTRNTIYGTVFIDSNGNGIKDSGEAAYYPTTVYLRNVADTTNMRPPQTTNTGFYIFGAVLQLSASTDYRVKHPVPSGYTATTDASIVLRPPATHNFGITACGNGQINTGEQCDNGAANGACPATCSTSCTLNSCGTAPTCSLTASPSSGSAPLSGTLTWATSNSPTSCTASGSWSGTKSSSGGSESYGPLNSNAAYQLTCTNAFGSGQCSAAVTIVSSSCGNGVKEGTEQCDGSDLGGQTCISRGYTGGTLGCKADCTFNIAGCTGVINPCSPNPCTNPPAPTCSGSTRIYYTSPGTCTVSGSSYTCNYQQNTQQCTNGCSNGQCIGTYTISGLVFLDKNQNGAVDIQDRGIQGETVLLQSQAGTTTYTTTTTSSGGAYSFTGTAGASYRITHYVQAGYIRTTDDSKPLDPLTANVVWNFGVMDVTAPTVSASISPSSLLPTGTSATITATASDTGGLASVSVVVDGSTVKTCTSSPCSHTFTPAYGTHTFSANAVDKADNSASSPLQSFTVNDAPAVQPISYTGDCKTGSTITLRCTASDTNQAANTLSTKVWAGQCDGANCFATRSWATGSGTTYFNGASMDPPATGGTFTKPLTITQPSGTSIAATCRATDSLGSQNSESQGDSYPLCTVDGCQNPAVITVNAISPNPAKAGTVQIGFTSDRNIQVNPTVTVKPGSQTGGTTEYPAVFVSRDGNSYVYRFDVQPAMLNGIADIKIVATSQSDNCPTSKIDNRLVIDTLPPTTSVLCNGAACTSNAYRSVTLTFSCSDATTSCRYTKYTIDSGAVQTYNPSSPPVLAAEGTHVVSYWSGDVADNVEATKSTSVRVYDSAGQEVRVKLVLDKSSALTGEIINGKIYCMLRDSATKNRIRDCNIDPATLSIIVDRGTQKQKNYFTSTGTSANTFISQNLVTSQETVVIDSKQYTISKKWILQLDTNIFHSEVCVGGSDGDSGLSGEDCGSYIVSDSQVVVEVTFPGAGTVIPLTQSGSPNFTKLMPINFEAKPYIATLLTTNPCTGVNCRVEFSFLPFSQWDPVSNPPLVAQWNEFVKAYVPKPDDVKSDYFECDKYRTLYVRATKQGGAESGVAGEAQEDFFVNCDTRLTVMPIEKRAVLDSVPGKSFNITVWNPKEGSERIFYVESTTTNPSGHPLPWISFVCEESGCNAEIGSDPWIINDDRAIFTVPQLDSRTAVVEVALAARSGSFPIKFIAAEGGNLYSATGTLLIFAEGLDEFAVWQLAGLLVLALAIFTYSQKNVTDKTKRKHKQFAKV